MNQIFLSKNTSQKNIHNHKHLNPNYNINVYWFNYAYNN